jgi:hypothetical protein
MKVAGLEAEIMTTYQNELSEALHEDGDLFFHGSSNISEYLLDAGNLNGRLLYKKRLRINAAFRGEI